MLSTFLILTALIWLCYRGYKCFRHDKWPWVGGLHHKCVLITGCDTGFGRATALRLYGRGIRVFAACYTEEAAHTLRGETGDTLQTFSLDLSSSQSILQGYEFVKDHLPLNAVLWGIVNNAGVAAAGAPLECVNRDSLRRVMEVNCFGTIEFTKTFLPLLKKSRGRIIFNSSVAGQVPYLTSFDYTISKYAIRAFAESLRFHLSPWGIQVCKVIPGSFRTDMNKPRDRKTRAEAMWGSMDPATQREYGMDYVHQALDAHDWLITSRARTDLSPVVDAYEHALFACQQHRRYVLGWDAKFMVFVQEYCPWFVLNMMGKYIVHQAVPRLLRDGL